MEADAADFGKLADSYEKASRRKGTNMVLQAFFLQLMARLQETVWRGQRGQALVEYGLMVALISIMAIAGLVAFQQSTDNVYDQVKLAADAMVDSLK